MNCWPRPWRCRPAARVRPAAVLLLPLLLPLPVWAAAAALVKAVRPSISAPSRMPTPPPRPLARTSRSRKPTRCSRQSACAASNDRVCRRNCPRPCRIRCRSSETTAAHAQPATTYQQHTHILTHTHHTYCSSLFEPIPSPSPSYLPALCLSPSLSLSLTQSLSVPVVRLSVAVFLLPSSLCHPALFSTVLYTRRDFASSHHRASTAAAVRRICRCATSRSLFGHPLRALFLPLPPRLAPALHILLPSPFFFFLSFFLSFFNPSGIFIHRHRETQTRSCICSFRLALFRACNCKRRSNQKRRCQKFI